MGTVYINARRKHILELLLSGGEYIPVQRITEETKVSRRSIYYDLCKINEWLNFYGIQELEVARGKGILIPAGDRIRIEALIDQENKEESYVFSPMERVKIIICYIIHLGEPVYIEQLSNYCQVSRNTIFNDLRAVVNQLQEYNLTLEYESKKGYRIGGDEIQVRALFFLYFYTLLPLFDSGVLNFIKQEEIQEYLDKLKKIEKELNTEYVNGVLLSLAALMPLMYQHGGRLHFPSLKKEEVMRTQEYRLIETYFPDLDKEEQIYLCLHLLGSRVAVATSADEMFENHADQSVYEITKALVAEFEKTACVVFENREELERSLFSHISTSLYRYQYGIQIGNPMHDDVIREYPNLYDITKIVTGYLSQMVGLPIPDSEVSYLALHFGAHLKISKPSADQLRILIVCVNGISTGNMLKREVCRLLPYARIVDVVAAVEAVNIQEICDLVISTVKIKSVVPSILVHPILTDYDRKVILNHRLVEQSQRRNETGALFDVIKKYVNEKDYEDLKLDLVKFFQGGDARLDVPVLKEPQGLVQFLQRDRIRITDRMYTWQDAIRFSGDCLVKAGSVESRYLEHIISQSECYGPYMFVTEGLALAHAKPEDGVHHLDIALTIFRIPVQFPEGKEARIIATLAAEDQEKHLKILKDIMTVFSVESMVETIAVQRSGEEILRLLAEAIKEGQE